MSYILATVPMVSMFDAGLRASVVGSNNDRERPTASEELAEIQVFPFNRPSTVAPDSVVEFYSPNGNLNGTGVNCTPPVNSAFDCKVKATYVRYDELSSEYKEDTSVRTLIQATVNVAWNSGSNSHSTMTLVSKESE